MSRVSQMSDVTCNKTQKGLSCSPPHFLMLLHVRISALPRPIGEKALQNNGVSQASVDNCAHKPPIIEPTLIICRVGLQRDKFCSLSHTQTHLFKSSRCNRVAELLPEHAIARSETRTSTKFQPICRGCKCRRSARL